MLSNHPSVLGSGAAGVTTPAAASAALDLISSTQGEMLYRNATQWVGLDPGTSGQLLSTQGAAANPIWVTATGGAGDVNGPTLGTATDNAIVRFDGTGGKTVQNSAVTIADTTGSTTWSNAGAVLALLGTTASTSTTTGALQVAGGVGVQGAGYFGGNLYVTSTTPLVGIGVTNPLAAIPFNQGGSGMEIKGTAATSLAISGTVPALWFYATGSAANRKSYALTAQTNSLALTSLNDAGSGIHTFFDANTATGTLTLGEAASVVNLPGTTASTSTTTGALINAGGFGNAGAAYFGGAVAIGNTVSVVSPTSPNRTITMVVGGVTLYIAAKTTND